MPRIRIRNKMSRGPEHWKKVTTSTISIAALAIFITLPALFTTLSSRVPIWLPGTTYHYHSASLVADEIDICMYKLSPNFTSQPKQNVSNLYLFHKLNVTLLVCLSVIRSVCLLVFLSFCQSVVCSHLSVVPPTVPVLSVALLPKSMSACRLACLSICHADCFSVFHPVHPSIGPSVVCSHLYATVPLTCDCPTCLYICLPSCLSTYYGQACFYNIVFMGDTSYRCRQPKNVHRHSNLQLNFLNNNGVG